MADERFKNIKWRIIDLGKGSVSQTDAQLALLMDLRDELQGIRQRLDCDETLQIPRHLRKIRDVSERVEHLLLWKYRVKRRLAKDWNGVTKWLRTSLTSAKRKVQPKPQPKKRRKRSRRELGR